MRPSPYARGAGRPRPAHLGAGRGAGPGWRSRLAGILRPVCARVAVAIARVTVAIATIPFGLLVAIAALVAPIMLVLLVFAIAVARPIAALAAPVILVLLVFAIAVARPIAALAAPIILVLLVFAIAVARPRAAVVIVAVPIAARAPIMLPLVVPTIARVFLPWHRLVALSTGVLGERRQHRDTGEGQQTGHRSQHSLLLHDGVLLVKEVCGSGGTGCR